MPCYRVRVDQVSTEPIYEIADEVYGTQIAMNNRVDLDVVAPESERSTLESQEGVVSVSQQQCPSGVGDGENGNGNGNGDGGIVGGLGPLGLGIGAGIAYYVYKNR